MAVVQWIIRPVNATTDRPLYELATKEHRTVSETKRARR